MTGYVLQPLEGVLETQLVSAPCGDRRSDLGLKGASESILVRSTVPVPLLAYDDDNTRQLNGESLGGADEGFRLGRTTGTSGHPRVPKGSCQRRGDPETNKAECAEGEAGLNHRPAISPLWGAFTGPLRARPWQR